MDTDGRHKRQLTRVRGRDDFSPTWTADGRIVFSGDEHLYVVNADGSGETPLGIAGTWPDVLP